MGGPARALFACTFIRDATLADQQSIPMRMMSGNPPEGRCYHCPCLPVLALFKGGRAGRLPGTAPTEGASFTQPA